MTTVDLVREKFWTDERAETCRRMWAEGWTAGAIGAELGCTRNSVLSKIHRCGWVGANSVVHDPSVPRSERLKGQSAALRRPTPPRPRPARPKKNTLAALAKAAMPLLDGDPTVTGYGRPKQVLELSAGDCRWPLGHPGQPGFAFCAAPALAGLSYCPAHCVLAYTHR